MATIGLFLAIYYVWLLFDLVGGERKRNFHQKKEAKKMYIFKKKLYL